MSRIDRVQVAPAIFKNIVNLLLVVLKKYFYALITVVGTNVYTLLLLHEVLFFCDDFFHACFIGNKNYLTVVKTQLRIIKTKQTVSKENKK